MSMMTRSFAWLLTIAFSALAADQEVPQPASDKTAVEWAVGLAGRFRTLHDPVVATYAIGQLAQTVCAIDRGAGADLFRDSLERLRTLGPGAFVSARHRLPVASFTSLWKSLTAAAGKCRQELADLADTDRARAKMQQERQQANDDLRQALSVLDSEPDRAAQLAETAMSASDPSVLDIPTLTMFLSQLRDRAADVADELFPKALDFVASPSEPSPELLLELGEYLFTAPKYLDVPDSQQSSDVRDIGSTKVADFTSNRRSSSSDDIHDYIAAAVKVLTSTNNPYYDAVAAYAIASQMLPKVDDYAPDYADKLREALPQITQLAGSGASQVQSAFTGKQGADPEGGEAARVRDRLVTKVLALVGSKRFAEARDLLHEVDDQGVSGQVRVLADFGEAAYALERKDPQWAFTLSNTIRGGVKRALLYAGTAVATQDRQEALAYFQLGIRDADLLPAEQRIVTAAALSSVMLPSDAENGFLALGLLVNAANDAYTSPHKVKFEPQVVRKVYSATASTFTDSSLILANSRCLCEVVDTGRGRHTFAVKVPGIRGFDLTSVVKNASSVDPVRLEAVLAGLRDETRLASAMNSLAALRLANGTR